MNSVHQEELFIGECGFHIVRQVCYPISLHQSVMGSIITESLDQGRIGLEWTLKIIYFKPQHPLDRVTWSWAYPGTGHLQLLWATFLAPYYLLSK